MLGKPDFTEKQNLLRVFSHAVQPRNKSHIQSSKHDILNVIQLAI